MIDFYAYLIVWLLQYGSLKEVWYRNQLLAATNKQVQQKDTNNLSVIYNIILSTGFYSNPHLVHNLALSNIYEKKYEKAALNLSRIIKKEPKNYIKSDLYEKLAFAQIQLKDTLRALASLKNCLQLNALAENARYNYELISKNFKNRHNTTPNEKALSHNKSQQEKMASEQTVAELDINATKKEELKRLKNLDLDEIKAKIILDALRNNEIQYLQQALQKQSNKQNNYTAKEKW